MAYFFLAKLTLNEGAFDWEIWIFDFVIKCKNWKKVLTMRKLSISIRNPNSIGKVRNLRKQPKVTFCIVQ